MLRCFIFFLFFTSISVFSQKVTIDPSLKVKYTDFKIDWPGNNQHNKPYRAHKQTDVIYKDSLVIQLAHVTWTAMILNVSIDKKGKVNARFLYYDDDGGRLTSHEFDSYDLTINTTKYKLGSIIKVKFTGKITFKGSILSLYGSFIHMVQDEPNKEARKLKNASKEKILKTGFYSFTGAYGEKYGLPKYIDEKGLKYYINTDSIVTLSSFKSMYAEPYTEKPGFTKLKFIIDNDFVERWKQIKSHKSPYGFILDNKVIFFGRSVIMENGFIIIDVKAQPGKETEEMVQKINEAIARAQEII